MSTFILNCALLHELFFLNHSTKWIPADDTLNKAPQWHGTPGITVYNLLIMITIQYSTIGDVNSQFECVFCYTYLTPYKNDLLCLHENNYENILLVLVSADDSSLF